MDGRRKNLALVILMICLLVETFVVSVYASVDMNFKKGSVAMPSRPSSLEGKTVLLRWNGKYNGDKFLSSIEALMMKQVKQVKIIRMWEKDPGTAVISKKMEISQEISSKIAKLKPDIVIAAQGDCGMCTSWLVIDQLNLEKRGIPTVTIVTSAFEELAKSAMRDQGVSNMSFVVVEHPVAGRNLKETQKLAEGYFQDIRKAATRCKPKQRP
jgi:ABC-type Fe3+-hydroxamate transport system substrate-binding protein